MSILRYPYARDICMRKLHRLCEADARDGIMPIMRIGCARRSRSYDAAHVMHPMLMIPRMPDAHKKVLHGKPYDL